MMSCWVARYLRCHFEWHINLMVPRHPQMILGACRDRMHKIKVSLDGFMICPSRPRIINLVVTILKIPKLQDYLVLAVVVRELSEASKCFLFDCCIFHCEVHIVELLLLNENKDTTSKNASLTLMSSFQEQNLSPCTSL